MSLTGTRRSSLRENLDFVRLWLRRPVSLGAILPSSKGLAQAMAEQVDPLDPGAVVELGGGTGSITMSDGFSYTGSWRDGNIDGEGVATYPNGDVYEGSFTNGRRSGAGRMTYASGAVEEGDWQSGRLVEDTEEAASE